MKNLIYQFWDNNGNTRNNLPGVNASRKNIKQYADRIGAEHLFEENPPLLHNKQFALYHGAFNPIFREEFHEYDNVLFLDADIHTVEDLEENIFEGFNSDIGLCTEPLQPKLRAETKVGMVNRHQNELWAKHVEKEYNMTIPRNKNGLLEIYNGGVVLYSNKGLVNAKKNFPPLEHYVDFVLSIKGCLPFFAADQDFLQVAIHATNTDFVKLDKGWNTFVTYHERDATRVIYDQDENTKFVHVQFRGANHLSEEELWKIVNLPVEKWGMGKKNVINEIR